MYPIGEGRVDNLNLILEEQIIYQNAAYSLFQQVQ